MFECDSLRASRWRNCIEAERFSMTVRKREHEVPENGLSYPACSSISNQEGSTLRFAHRIQSWEPRQMDRAEVSPDPDPIEKFSHIIGFSIHRECGVNICRVQDVIVIGQLEARVLTFPLSKGQIFLIWKGICQNPLFHQLCRILFRIDGQC